MRSPTDSARRAFENTVANFPVLLITIAGQIAAFMLIVIGVIIAILPLVGLGVIASVSAPQGDPSVWLEKFVQNNPLIILYLVVAVLVLMIPMMMLYAFIEAGRIGVYLDGERKALAAGSSERSAFNAFDPSRWMAHARASWLGVFVVYVLTGLLAVLLLVVPIVLIAVMMARFSDYQAVVGVGCMLLVLVVLCLVLFGIFIGIWVKLANIICVRDRVAGTEALRRALAAFVRDPGGVLILTMLLVGVSIGVGIGVMSIYFGTGVLSAIPGVGLLLIPLQIALSLGQSVLSAFLSSWFSASYVSYVVAQEG